MAHFTEITTGLFTVENFMPATECLEWIRFSEQTGYEEAAVNVGRGQQKILKHIRNNERILYDDQDLADELWRRVAQYVPQKIGRATAIGLNERFRFYKYFPGQQFKAHQDGRFIRNPREYSLLTFMVYLNDNFKGGETKFTDHTIIPKTGMALIFQHRLVHEGAPVISGVKYVLRSDVMYWQNPSNE